MKQAETEFAWPQDRLYRPDADHEGIGVADVAMELFCIATGSSDGAVHGSTGLRRRARWLQWRLETWQPSLPEMKATEDALRVYCTSCLGYAMTFDPILSKGL